MAHAGQGTDPNQTVRKDLVDRCVDDEAHRFPLVRRPKQTQRCVLTEQRDRALTKTDRDHGAVNVRCDMREARRAVRGRHGGVRRGAVQMGYIRQIFERNLHAHRSNVLQPPSTQSPAENADQS